MTTKKYASRFTQLYRRMHINGTLELNGSCTSQQCAHRLTHVGILRKVLKKGKKSQKSCKLSPTDIKKTDDLHEQLQKTTP